MSDPSILAALTARLALLSSISFGGFPTVLPDVRHFVVVAHGWVTDQEFTNYFALAQSIPGPNMILMMSFVGWKVWGLPGALASAVATFGPPCTIYFASYSPVGPVPRRAMAGDCAQRACPGNHRARDREWHRHGPGRRCRLAGGCGDDRRRNADVEYPAQSALDAFSRWDARWAWPSLSSPSDDRTAQPEGYNLLAFAG